MASNSSIISDPIFDESGDWVELFNDNNEPIDVSGYFLTDNFGNPTKWSFPEGTIINPNSFYLIWADGKNVGNHTSYKLTKDGEEIGLYDKDTLEIDNIIYQHQKTNVSMGRSLDGSSDIGFFTEPTPGSSNITQFFTGITYYQPRFSIKGGIHTNSFDLELTSIDGEIRYTIDGSLPTMDSEIYTAPLQIDQTSVIRASVFLKDHIPGKPISHTYFLDPSLKERTLPIVAISTDPKNFWDESIGLYVQDFKPAWEYPINIELFENDGSDRAAFNELAGTKVNGLNSWVLPQKMLGIYFDNDYDKNNLEYQLFFDKDRKRFDNFVLRASGSDWGSTLFRDVLSQGLTAQNMNIEKMAFRPSIVYVNGEYMGIHNMRSRIDEGYIEENFGLASTEYDLIENNGVIEEGDNEAFDELFKLFDNDMKISANFDEVAAVMDLDNFTDYFITQIWSSNSSWGHNIQMWKPKQPDTKWRWILQDLDRGFTGIEDELISKFTTSMSPLSYNWARTPLNSLLENETYSKRFAQRFTDHLYTTFHANTVTSAIEEHKDLIDQEISYHSDRWAGSTSSYGDGLPSVEYWENEVSKLITFANGRPNVLIEDIKNRFGLGDPTSLTIINNPKSSGQVSINSLPIAGSPWQGQYFKNMPFQLEAKSQVGQEFIGWSTADFEPLVNMESDWKYLDNGSDQGTAWRTIDFNDSSWNTGMAKFGYGDGNENTTISFGQNSSNKFITTYFRKEIIISDVNSYTGALLIKLLRDDGAVVYINGKEIIRSNIPDGAIEYQTAAMTFVAGIDESSYIEYLIEDCDLLEGKNTIAVEIHQVNGSSSDLGFDLSVDALRISKDLISTENIIDVNLNSDSIFVANYQSTDLCTLPQKISSNMTLDLSCSPYYAIGNVVVDSSVTLTIEEGVQIYFPEDKSLEIHGSLIINGSENQPVSITALGQDKPWGGLIFKYATSNSLLQYLEISKASNGSHPIYENAAISAYHSKVEMDHITLEDLESNPILSYYSDIILNNSTLHSKVTGDLINIKYGKGKVNKSIFKGNSQVDTDAIDFDGVIDGEIIGNKIYDFSGYNSDGIDIGEETNDVSIVGNFIHNCSDKGISVGQNSTLNANHNVIVNCDKGIAIKDLSYALIKQNTFYNIGNPIACFEKNVGLGGGFSLVTNSIFSNSSGDPIVVDDVSNIELESCLSDTDSLSMDLNFYGNPLFTSPSFNDFSLLPSSIAKDAGFDDINGTIIDLGAESNTYRAEPSLMISAIQYFPSGNQDAEFILLFNPKSGPIDLEGYRLADAIEFTFPSGAIVEAEETILVAKNLALISQSIDNKYQWTSGRLSNEGETIELIAPSGIVIDHVKYDNKAPWPADAEGKGSHLKLINPSLDNHFAESWKTEINTSSINNSVESQVVIYPNPAKEIVTIQSYNELIHRIEIINVLGQTVYAAQNNSSRIEININHLQPGTILLKQMV